MDRQQVIEAIARDNAIALRHRIDALQKIDDGEDPEEVLQEFKELVREAIANCHEDV